MTIGRYLTMWQYLVTWRYLATCHLQCRISH